MGFGLKLFEYYDDSGLRRGFRFAVVDFSKSKSYPQNFVCMLPLQFGAGKVDSALLKVFKDKSLEQAKALLKAAWEQEDDSEVKAEIERRLRLLEPRGVNQVKCSSCGKLSTQTHKKVQEQFLRRMHDEEVWKPRIEEQASITC